MSRRPPSPLRQLKYMLLQLSVIRFTHGCNHDGLLGKLFTSTPGTSEPNRAVGERHVPVLSPIAYDAIPNVQHINFPKCQVLRQRAMAYGAQHGQGSHEGARGRWQVGHQLRVMGA